MTSIPHPPDLATKNAAGPPTELNPLDPTLLAALLGFDHLWMVDREDDCELLRAAGFPGTWLEAGERLTKRQLSGVKYIIVLGRPGPDGDAFGVQVLDQLEKLKWHGQLYPAKLSDLYWDLSIVARETAGDRTRFAVFIADCAGRVDPVMLPRGKAATRGGATRGKRRGATTATRQGDADDHRPEINASITDLPIIAADTWKALLDANEPPQVFVQGRELMRLECDHTEALIAVQLTRERLRHRLARIAKFFVPEVHDGGVEGQRIVLPPMWLVDDLLARPEPPLPPLARITEAPVFGPDGTLQTTPGYHPASRTFYAPPRGVKIPDVPTRPSRDDVTLANLLIEELLCDFKFVNAADKAHAKALWLLPFVRDLIEDATPNHLIESPGPGSGKTLLADVLVRPAIGRHVGIVTEGRDDDEWRKRLTAVLREARAVLLLDNIRRPLESGQLAAALTASAPWSDRLLGKNEMISAPVRCCWVTTGNNPVVSTEIARRSIRIRLDPESERPWLRQGFQHENLRAWVDRQRGRLIWAALVLAQHWLAQDRPAPHCKPLGSYEGWTVVIGGILEAAGIEGFLGNLEDFYEIADHEGTIWRGLVNAWAEKFGMQVVGAGDLFQLAVEMDGFNLGHGNDKAQRTVFGVQLTRQRDRVIGGYRIAFVGERWRTKRWRLLPTTSLSPR
jgi:putative DNA primase/helicase